MAATSCRRGTPRCHGLPRSGPSTRDSSHIPKWLMSIMLATFFLSPPGSACFLHKLMALSPSFRYCVSPTPRLMKLRTRQFSHFGLHRSRRRHPCAAAMGAPWIRHPKAASIQAVIGGRPGGGRQAPCCPTRWSSRFSTRTVDRLAAWWFSGKPTPTASLSDASVETGRRRPRERDADGPLHSGATQTTTATANGLDGSPVTFTADRHGRTHRRNFGES